MKRLLYVSALLLFTAFFAASCGLVPAEIVTESGRTSIGPSFSQQTTTSAAPTMTEYDVSNVSNLALEEIFSERPAPEELVQLMKMKGIDMLCGREYDGALYEGWEGGGYNCTISMDSDHELLVTISFDFYEDKTLFNILAYGKDAPATARGARIGDVEEKIIELYGAEYQKKVIYTSFAYLEYHEGDIFLMFKFDNGRLKAWAISIESVIGSIEESGM